MYSLSSSRPLFLSRTTRRILTFKKVTLIASGIVGGFFIAGVLVGVVS